MAVLSVIVSVVPSVTATCNALGRIGYSTISDKLKDRSTIYQIIFSSCIAVCLITVLTSSIPAVYRIIIIALLMIVNLGYGGGFSTLPALLESRFGMENISKIHGIALSAWAVAGLTGNNTSEIILTHSGTYNHVIMVAFMLYLIALIICRLLVAIRGITKSTIQ